MWTENDVVMVEVDWLKPHEQIKSKGNGKLKDLIYTKNTWEIS